MNDPYQQGGGAAIALTTKFIPLAWIFSFIKPNVSVDGQPVAAAWGRTVIPVSPGHHRLDVHVPYFLPPRVGPAETVFTVQPGQTVELEYRAPAWAFSRGSLGAPPQKYNGMGLLIAIMVIAVFFVFCACGVSLLASFSSTS